MPLNKALNCFLGKEGCPRLNCVQSVLVAFGVDEDTIKLNSKYGAGQAPEGWCGAAYAAQLLINDKTEIEKYFLKQAGAVTCRQIRRLKKLSCIGCIEKSVEFIQSKRRL